MAKFSTFLQAAIPHERGPAKHTEWAGDLAQTVFARDGTVKEIKTPQEPFRRVHEVLHARHTRAGEYGTVRDEVAQIVEDCRLHMHHWPWAPQTTPPAIQSAARAIFDQDTKFLRGRNEDDPSDFPSFATTLREHTVLRSMGLKPAHNFDTKAQAHIAEHVKSLILSGHHLEAAALLEHIFFREDEDELDQDGDGDGSDGEGRPSDFAEIGEMVDEASKTREVREAKGWGKKSKALENAMRMMGNGTPPEKMEFIELPLTEATVPENEDGRGHRVAKSGTRLHRPSLRRPILPQRIFHKQTPTEPGGAVLFDASSSMSVDEDILFDCCMRAPMATVAYYAGDDCSKGKFYLFAKDGMRCSHVVKPPWGGNTVDGQALDWLMKQEGPRLFVTDRGFCGANDSIVQLARLERLEHMGEVKVYTSYSGFRKAFPKATT